MLGVHGFSPEPPEFVTDCGQKIGVAGRRTNTSSQAPHAARAIDPLMNLAAPAWLSGRVEPAVGTVTSCLICAQL